MGTRTGASVPDAAKPQTLPSEVEARFRDSSRSMHGFQRRSRKTQARALYAPDLLGGHQFMKRGMKFARSRSLSRASRPPQRPSLRSFGIAMMREAWRC